MMLVDECNLNQQVPETASLVSLFSSSTMPIGVEKEKVEGTNKFNVIGHRGNGMNMLQSSDVRMKDVKENSILSFNTVASFNVDFIEFDVQVTKGGVPIIFHDDFILSMENGTIFDKRVAELNISEFLAYGPQKEAGYMAKPSMRKTEDGGIIIWDVKSDDAPCTLQEAFEKVDTKLGFNIELKFDDYIVYQEAFLANILQSSVKVVCGYAKERRIIFSKFQADAALIMWKLQQTYPVFFLTNGGTEVFYDTRRNSLEEASNLCLEGGLQGIVSEVKGVFRNPGAVNLIKDSNLSLFTYGTLNNVPELVYLQYLMGIDGVVVDHVQDIAEAVSDLIIKPAKAVQDQVSSKEDGRLRLETKPKFSKKELSFLLTLIPELTEH